MELTILMPCLNEALTIEKCVRDALHFLTSHRIDGEVLVADNGSVDGSVEIASKAGARVVKVHEKGYGAALLGGIYAANGRYIIMGDADDSYDFIELQNFIIALRSGSQLVMGNRFKGGIEKGAMPFLHRWLGNPVLSAIGRLFFNISIGDFHCGLRGFDTQAIRGIHLIAPGMEFATEMVAKAALAGLKISEVPTRLRPDGRDRAPHLRTWRDGWRHLRFMLLFSPLWLFLVPGMFMLVPSLVGLISLSQGPVYISGIGLDVHTMLFCGIGVALGFQALQWGILIQWLGIEAGMRIPPRILQKIKKKSFLGFEFCLIVGLVIFLLGLFLAIRVTNGWVENSLGAINEPSVLRKVIVASTLMVTGGQALGGIFFAAGLNACIRSGFIRIRN